MSTLSIYKTNVSQPGYLSELKNCPKLSNKENLALVRIVQEKWTPYRDRFRSDRSSLSPQEYREAVEGKRALDKLIKHNIKLVVKLANRHERTNAHHDLDTEDLIGLAATIAIEIAAVKFDFSRKTAWSTYVCPWIRQIITRQIQNTGTTIRKPAHFYGQLSKVKVAYKELCQELGYRPTAKEIAMRINCREDSVLACLNTAKPTRSLSSPVRKSDEDLLLIDTIEDFSHGDAYSRAEVDHLLSYLDERDRVRLYDCFAFDRLKDAGEKHGVSGQMMGKVKEQSLRRLRAIVSHEGIAS